MHRIDADFERLQPIAFDQAFEREGVRRRRDEAIEGGKGGGLAGAEKGEQDAALLDDGICSLANVGAEIALGRLGRSLETLALRIEQPAVKRTAQAAVLEPAVSEVSAAVRTMPADETVTSALVFEDHQIFAKQTDRLDRAVAGKLVNERRRLPIAPHQVAGRRALASAGDEIVLFAAEHRASRAGRRAPAWEAMLYD